MRLELFDVSRRWPRQRTQINDGTRFREQRNFVTAFCSIRWPYITVKFPPGDMDTPPRPRNFFRYLAIRMCHFRHLWNGMCDRHPAEITVIQFRGHSLPVHQSMSVSWAFTLSHFVNQIRLRDFFRLLAIGMCHFPPVHHFGIACLAWSKVNIQQDLSKLIDMKVTVIPIVVGTLDSERIFLKRL